MNELTCEEVRAMRGVEFTYIFSDGDTIPAFVAEVQMGRGLTCKALCPKTKNGTMVWTEWEEENNPKEYDNIICYPSEIFNLDYHIMRVLTTIKETGFYQTNKNRSGGAIASCSF